jgi:hypothetical protein
MYLVINKCVTAVKVSNFSRHYLRNRSTFVIGVSHKEHPPEFRHIPPGTPVCVCVCVFRAAAIDIPKSAVGIPQVYLL